MRFLRSYQSHYRSLSSVHDMHPVNFFAVFQIERFLKSLFPFANHLYYQYYENVNGYFQLKEDIDNFIFAIDGHPSFTSDGKYMITDTYPYEDQYQKLIVYNIATKKSIVLGSFYAGLNKKAGTCDLHPKLCRNNDFLAVDSAHNGKHHTMLFKLNWNKIKQKID